MWPWAEDCVRLPGEMSNGRPWPKVSIVTPSYNQARFLEATIRSVLLQGYPNLEYAVIDGGSTDGSTELIQRYASRLPRWVSEPDVGQADAINKGWRRAQGDILAYLNSDDLYLLGAVRRAVEYLEDHPHVGIVYGACQVIDELGQPIGGPREMPECSLARLLRCPLPQPTMFFRRWVFDRIGWLDAGLHCTLDWDLTIRAAIAGIVIEPIPGPPLAAARVWDGAKTSNLFELCVEESLRIRDKLLSHPSLPLPFREELVMSKAWVFLWPAYEYYVRGQIRSARRLLHRAVAIHPAIIAHPEFLGLYLRALLGRSGSQAARRLKARLTASAFLREAAAVLRKKRGKGSGWRWRAS